MNKGDWNHEFPEVPERIHNRIIDTLNGLESRECVNVKKIRKKRVLVLAAAIIAVMGTTALAAELFQWNERAANVFVSEEAEQNELVAEGMTEEGKQSVTDNGITVKAVQTIQDNNCFYALFEVTAQDKKLLLDETNDFQMDIDYNGKENPFSYIGSGFISNEEEKVSNKRYFEIWATKDDTQKTQELDMKLTFLALQQQSARAGAGKDLIKGSWKFDLHVKNTAGIVYTINQNYNIDGYDVFLKQIEISPISAVITCSKDSIMKLEEGEKISLEQLDTIEAMTITGVQYTDGTQVDETENTLVEGYEDNSESYKKVLRFSRVIAPEKLQSIFLGKSKTEIRLP